MHLEKRDNKLSSPGQPWLQSEFKASLDYEIYCMKNYQSKDSAHSYDVKDMGGEAS